MNRNALRQTVLFVTSLVILIAVFQQTAVACPTCKNGLAEGQENVAQGYFWSILFMMSMPFIIFGGLGLYFYLAIRRARARRSESDAATFAAAGTTAYANSAYGDEPAGELLEV